MKVVFRYRTSKPTDGHLSFQLHEGATILSFAEHWHTEKGWEVLVDVLEDTSQPKERRGFFLCNSGDNLDFLGEYPDVHYVGTHSSKSYCSFLFETSHLSETERVLGKVQQDRYVRHKPSWDEMSRTDRQFEKARDMRARAERAGTASPTKVEQAFDEASRPPSALRAVE